MDVIKQNNNGITEMSYQGWAWTQIKKFFPGIKIALSEGQLSYTLTEKNIKYLASALSLVTKKDYVEIKGYLDEIISDQEFIEYFSQLTRANPYLRSRYGQRIGCGRRIGNYALVRALKPKVVIETGVEAGLNTCVIAAALLKNKEEGYGGCVYGLEIDRTQGVMVQSPYSQCVSILWGDSLDTLNNFDKTIDIFITDSTHDPKYEAKEYEAAKYKLSPTGIIVANNAHTRDSLHTFALKQNKKFLYFAEERELHWREGGAFGFVY